MSGDGDGVEDTRALHVANLLLSTLRITCIFVFVELCNSGVVSEFLNCV